MIERRLLFSFVTSAGACAAVGALVLAVPPARAQTAQPAAPAATAAPDVSRIVIRRPAGDVVEPESYRAPTPIGPDANGGEASPNVVETGAPAAPDAIEQQIILRQAPTEPGVGTAPSIPNATSADVNDPGVRVRLPSNN